MGASLESHVTVMRLTNPGDVVQIFLGPPLAQRGPPPSRPGRPGAQFSAVYFGAGHVTVMLLTNPGDVVQIFRGPSLGQRGPPPSRPRPPPGCTVLSGVFRGWSRDGPSVQHIGRTFRDRVTDLRLRRSSDSD